MYSLARSRSPRASNVLLLKYARAGIAHYWRVENEKGPAIVHAFELEPTTGTYVGVGIFRERMKVSAPFPMDLDLTAIKARPSGE
ncbi:hypothetical protein GCM10023323_52430 [Streptomyces thinghirensis]|uniref:Uma2 family endonuclease n=1 Tax=Streptomyces thinghirensis TaxID=551547 RepID=A0ABP9TC49_9ACTN